ncbi:RNA-binding protein [Candidatus Woesearchaeota archaeon]|nr:RNA-binding protein [Candidatus Woesearchaeota archaeon]
MTKLMIKEREVVVPGDIIAEGMNYLPSTGTYRQGQHIMASRMGIMRLEGKVVKIIPLAGKYLPRRGDVIIGKIIDVNIMAWRVETNSAYSAMLSVKDGTSSFVRRGADLTRIYAIGDYIITKIINVTSQKLVDLTMRGPGLKKLDGGRIIKVTPTKVPRIIGKEGSMVVMIKSLTNCDIMVGQNGIVWIKGEPKDEILAVETIRKIEDESHVSGLTDKIKNFLESAKR